MMLVRQPTLTAMLVVVLVVLATTVTIPNVLAAKSVTKLEGLNLTNGPLSMP